MIRGRVENTLGHLPAVWRQVCVSSVGVTACDFLLRPYWITDSENGIMCGAHPQQRKQK